MPFDPLGMGYAPGRRGRNLRFVLRLLREADRLARSVEADLPPDYPLEADAELVAELEGEIAATTYASSTNSWRTARPEGGRVGSRRHAHTLAVSHLHQVTERCLPTRHERGGRVSAREQAGGHPA